MSDTGGLTAGERISRLEGRVEIIEKRQQEQETKAAFAAGKVAAYSGIAVVVATILMELVKMWLHK